MRRLLNCTLSCVKTTHCGLLALPHRIGMSLAVNHRDNAPAV
jgi:hypothetical protein